MPSQEKGEPGRWVVKKIEHAPSADNVVEQTKLDETDYRFPFWYWMACPIRISWHL